MGETKGVPETSYLNLCFKYLCLCFVFWGFFTFNTLGTHLHSQNNARCGLITVFQFLEGENMVKNPDFALYQAQKWLPEEPVKNKQTNTDSFGFTCFPEEQF